MASTNKSRTTVRVINDHGPMGYVLFMSWVGALVYFESQAYNFWTVIVAFFKACVWPAYLLFYLFRLLHI